MSDNHAGSSFHYRFGVIGHHPRRHLSFAHEALDQRSDAERKSEFDVFREIGAKVIAIEPIEDFKWLTARDHAYPQLLLFSRQHGHYPFWKSSKLYLPTKKRIFRILLPLISFWAASMLRATAVESRARRLLPRQASTWLCSSFL